MTLRYTEHALFRYCQRVLGADMRWLIKQLESQIGPVSEDGDYELKDHDAYAVVKNGFVVTILTASQLQKVQSGKFKKPRKRFRFQAATEDQ